MTPGVIVHADDFGLTEPINRGIVQAHCEGIVTSTSIVANGAAFEHAVKLARSEARLDLGVHLALTQEKPLLPLAEVSSLVGASGSFHRSPAEFAARYLTGRVDLEQAYRELRAQVARVFDTGLQPSHLDSHQHLHLLPGVFEAVVRIAGEFNIHGIRLTRERALWAQFGRVPTGRLIGASALVLLCLRARPRLRSPIDGFLGFLHAGHLTADRLIRMLARVPPGSTWEVGCHPGVDDAGSPYGDWGYRWGEELAALTDPATLDFVRERCIRLESWSTILKGSRLH